MNGWHDDGGPLALWLARGQAWLGDMQASGLAGASACLVAAGQAWADEAALLGWHSVAGLVDQVLQPQADPEARASAFLDLMVWIATACSLQGLLPAAGEQALP